MVPKLVVFAALGIALAFPSTTLSQTAEPGSVRPSSKMISVSFQTANLQRSVAFYNKFLGLTQSRVIENPQQKKIRLDFPNGGPGLLIIQDKSARTPLASRPRIGRMNLEVPDLRGLRERLAAAGYRFSQDILESKEYHVLAAVLIDPDGNELELIQHTN